MPPCSLHRHRKPASLSEIAYGHDPRVDHERAARGRHAATRNPNILGVNHGRVRELRLYQRNTAMHTHTGGIGANTEYFAGAGVGSS